MDAERLKAARTWVHAYGFHSDGHGFAAGLIRELLDERAALRAKHFAEAVAIAEEVGRGAMVNVSGAQAWAMSHKIAERLRAAGTDGTALPQTLDDLERPTLEEAEAAVREGERRIAKGLKGLETKERVGTDGAPAAGERA